MAKKDKLLAGTANPDRGEHELTLGGRTYLLRPSFAATRAIETRTGKSLLALVRLGNIGELTFDQVGIVAAEYIRAGAEDEMTRAVDPERLAELAYEGGISAAMARLTMCMLDAASGGRSASGEAMRATATGSPGTVA